MQLTFDVPQSGHRGLLELSAICRRTTTEVPLTGYLRLDCDKVVEAVRISVRCTGYQQLKVRTERAAGGEDIVLVPATWSSPRSVWHQRADVFLVVDETWRELRRDERLEPGSHLLAWRLSLPSTLPPSGESWLAKASYLVVASATGTAAGLTSWLTTTQEASASRELHISAHPSNLDVSRLNPIDLRFRRAGEPSALFARAQLRTPNGRYGGCFDVEGSIELPDGEKGASITSIELHFEQHWIYRGQGEVEGKDQSSSLALDKNRSWVEAASEAPVGDLDAPTASQSKDPPAYVEASHAGRTLRFSCSSHLPSEAVEGASGYYQTTLDFTRVSVRFRHILTCRLRVELQGKEHEVVLEAEPIVVGKDLRTESLAIPAYEEAAS